MRKVRFSVVLPVVLVAIQGALWYWGTHSTPTIPAYLAPISAAVPIRTGLNGPIELVLIFGWSFLSEVIRPYEPRFLFELIDLLWVGVCWYWIGRWLDRRSIARAQVRVFGIVLSLALMTLGAVVLSLPFRERAYHLARNIENAGLQTWAIFLIGIPCVTLMRWFKESRLQQTGHISTETYHMATEQFSSLTWCLIAGALFVILLAYSVITQERPPIGDPQLPWRL